MKVQYIATSRTHGPRKIPFDLFASVGEESTRYDWESATEHPGNQCRFRTILGAIQDAEFVLEQQEETP